MAGFTENALEKKLNELTNSQQTIQTLSLWLIHHRRNCATIVKVWYKEFCKVSQERKLTFLYLANDVIQNSKKKGPEFSKEFGNMLKKAFSHLGQISNLNDKTKKGAVRILDIWDERGVYDTESIADFKRLMDAGSDEHPAKRPKNMDKVEKRSKKKIKVVEEVSASPDSPAIDVPEPNTLIRALQELEQAASTDEETRAKLVNLPAEVTDSTLLGKLRDRGTAERLCAQVNNAATMLADYNDRLQDELQQRKSLLHMLFQFTQDQRKLVQQTEDKLDEYRDRLSRINEVKNELELHLHSLPDLTQLPDLHSGGLRPLPSAGDLFSMAHS